MVSALATQAEVLFTEAWDQYFDINTLDETRWRADDGCFGDGIYMNCHGTFEFIPMVPVVYRCPAITMDRVMIAVTGPVFLW